MVQSPYENLPFQSYHSNLKNVALEYKRLLKIKITDSSLLRDILENPYYPSLLSLSDTFKKYSIKNVAYRISGEYLDEMEVPFIGLMNLDSIGSDFILVKKITKNTVTYFYNKKRTETIERNEFLKRFENIALVFLGEEKNGEERDSYNFRKENTSKSRIAILTGSVAIIISFLIAINFTTNNALPFVLISIFKLLGLSAIIFLLLYEFNRNNKLARNICGLSSETNCDAVLSSRGAKILGISWSEIGLFYFVSTGLVLFVSGFAFTTKIGWLSLMNAFAAPFILFSTFYQWRIIKLWCPLCLLVQIVLATELIWSISYFWIPVHSLTFLTSSSTRSILILGVLMISPVVGWFCLKPSLLRSNDYDLYRSAYKRLQHNPDIFRSLLIQQTKAPENWKSLGINVGNPHANNTIIKVCSPYCNPCAETHPKLEEIIRDNKNVNLKVIFTGGSGTQEDRTSIIRHLLAIAAQYDTLTTERALADWYQSPKKDYNAFASKYPIKGELKDLDVQIESMSKWCKETGIVHTPTIFVNGYKLPDNYELGELNFIFQVSDFTIFNDFV